PLRRRARLGAHRAGGGLALRAGREARGLAGGGLEVTGIAEAAQRAAQATWHEAEHVLRFGRPLPGGTTELRWRGAALMGVVNVTPDSFSDGGLHSSPGDAVSAGLRMVEQGALIVDVGGESTRPGAAPV